MLIYTRRPNQTASQHSRVARVAVLASMLAVSVVLIASRGTMLAGDGNRLAYLDEFCDPYYPSHEFPRLITPQWIGEDDVEAAVILSIDDMREPTKYEAFLRPILERLKKIDGRAPVSIFTLSVNPQDQHLQKWLREGLSFEVHTTDHPCPLFQGGDFEPVRRNVDDCLDLLSTIPNTHPVAYRGPCSDVWNTHTPRFYTEIFNRGSPLGNFLTISSTVHHVFSGEDPALPRELVVDEEGKPRFAKYTTGEVPIVGRNDYVYVNHVVNYPYPYVVGRLAWEFPCTIPGDHQAHAYIPAHGRHLVRDWKGALDATYVKQGVMTLVFHPHGRCTPEEIIALIDYAVEKYGGKVKFLNLREAEERLNRHLLAEQPLRAVNGQDNGVRVLDLNGDGFLDVVIGNEHLRETRVWRPRSRDWLTGDFPVPIVEIDSSGSRRPTGVRFGILDAGGAAALLVRSDEIAGAWRFDEDWIEKPSLLWGLSLDGEAVFTQSEGVDRGVRLRDVDRDGICELIIGNHSQNAVFSWSEENTSWRRRKFSLPANTSIVDSRGRDAGLRFVDVNADGYEDVLFSNEERYSLHLYIRAPGALRAFDQVGWTRPVSIGVRGEPGEIPPVVRGGEQRNNGVWFAKGRLWVQNEDTGDLPHHTVSRSFDDLVSGFQPPPLSPEESLATFEVPPGFKVELVATEPLVKDPISIAWAPNGELWVVEMRDYPTGLDGKGTPGGAIRILSDDDADGQYDRSRVFIDGLNFPSGVMPWQGGALISAAPDILYAEDTDGDGRADRQQVLFTGFALGNQQHRVNGFAYGLDNWVYCANGASGGTVRSLLSDQVVDIRGRDFRIQPNTGRIETEPGVTEFGRHRDDWGNWFGNTYANWGWHYYLPDRYLKRNPHLRVRSVRRDLADGRDLRLIHRQSRLLTRPQMGQPIDQVTAPCSLSPYRDDLFGADFASSIFIGEVDKNIVRRMLLVPDGVSFTARLAPGEEGREFLSSTDNWFRPTQSKTGPDGALYVVDMYRLIIEHEEYYPADLQRLLDFRAGDDKGRIFRIFPEGVQLRSTPRLGELDAKALVAAIDHANGWQRDTAQRLLVARQDPTAVVPLKEMFKRNQRAKARLHALCTLDGLGALTPELLTHALGDTNDSVREHAVRLSERFLAEPRPPAEAGRELLAGALLRKVDDPSIRVRYQLAFTLGEWFDPRVGPALVHLAEHDLDSEDMQTAVMSSAVPHIGAMLESLLGYDKNVPASRLVERWLGLATLLGNEGVLARALVRIADAKIRGARWQFQAVAGLLTALYRENSSLAALHDRSGAELKAAIETLGSIFSAARQSLESTSATFAERLAAVGILGRGLTDVDADVALLAKQLERQVPPKLQLAAVEALAVTGREGVPEALLAEWRRYGPVLRARTLGVLGTREAWLAGLLKRVTAGDIASGEIGLAQQQMLLGHSNLSIREKAATLFEKSRADRSKVIDEYSVVRGLRGDTAAGAPIFQKHCAPCHRRKGQGAMIGPDLDGVVGQPVQFLLESILDPSRSIDPEFTQYTAITQSGRLLTGVIAEETLTSLTLRVPGRGDEILLRNEIAEIQSSAVSIMPTGVEKELNPQAMADLIAWLKSAENG